VYAYFQLAKIARAKGRSQEAIELLKRALKRDENYLDAYLELAEIYLSFCDLKNARSFLRAASFRHPSDLRVRQLTEKYEELLETYDMRCKLAETLHERAVELKKRGKIDETTEKLTLALTLNRGYGEAYNDLGVLYYLNGDYETARKFIELATQCSPDNLEYLKNLASVYLALGREEVIEIYERILSKTPDDAETLITLATLLKMVGKEEDAVSLLRVAAKVDPTYQGLKENLAIPQREGQL
jgi:tetratricopeptide (TPR) repeat protein